MTTLRTVLYAGAGRWRACLSPRCSLRGRDWGADALTYAVYLAWQTTADRRSSAILSDVATALPTYRPCRLPGCTEWSDIPAWDAIAAARAFQATRDRRALARAIAAYDAVVASDAYSGGACPDIRFQRPPAVRARDPGQGAFKTLETDANLVKAALLLFDITRRAHYLREATATYASIRSRFLDPAVPLYTVYLEDSGTRCVQLPHRFFASVNGAMIWNGLELGRLTKDARYRDQAVATAHAIDSDVADGRGVFADLQAENDVEEPLVEGMLELALREPERGGFARAWILRNAGAAVDARRADGTYGRFFDGPPPASVTAWQTNGGLALAIAAARLAPESSVIVGSNAWRFADARDETVTTADLPKVIDVRGTGVALFGTLGERCCDVGHVRVFVDGRETFDHSGIWQGKSSADVPVPHSILFAWRWPRAGHHTIKLVAGGRNGKEGDAFLHVSEISIAR